MKTGKRYMVMPEKINSLQDIEMEKQRLRLEIMKKEENIHSDYRHILDALSFRNLASTMINDISATSSLVSKAFAFGKSVVARRKKKKHDKMKAATDDNRS
jgi:hypothetical protein